MEHKRQLELAERELERAKKMREGGEGEAKLGGGGYGISMLSSPSQPTPANIKVRFADDPAGKDNGGASSSDVRVELELTPKSALKTNSEHV